MCSVTSPFTALRPAELFVLVGLILAGCQASGSASAESSASPFSTESWPLATVSSTPVATSEATSSAAPGQFARDVIVVVVTTDLVVRSAPGTGSDSDIMSGRYNAPEALFIVDGPAHADGYEWYLVEVVRGQGIGDYPWPGWVAAAGKDGEPWLALDTRPCPSPTQADLISLERQRALACFGSSRLTVEGTLTGCEDAVALGSEPWDTQCTVVRRGFDVDATPPPCFDCFEPTLWVFFDGDIGLEDLPMGAQVRVYGHFDDSAAQTCTRESGIHSTRTLQIHACRLSFVATSSERLD